MHFIEFAQNTGMVINTQGLPQAQADTPKLFNLLNVVFGVVASIAVLIIVIAGFRYIVAHGDPNATAQARNAILYAVVGLLITMAAYSVVLFVVNGIA